ncbi:conserved hypothetical protein [Heliomicrobium modesticaldum Ice1]|uniref:SiaC family regulatory phosphoprotein domain-containing protein n=1 Tax=Heliobacterium modesticaldum (strain ATCC 51547 / Ice1) TaxID=498761 RepID=B0TDB4_HELMI|nr:DUF1987 domain-containing protein [Heliomicrobium modesticaldum]ABZ84155.1 conserved hypothetical protein [Heliomicrobium modesticaldum Ice1]
MDKLYITGAKGTPEVDFDPFQHTLKLSGQSYPENAFKFYEPILRWVDAYLEQLTAEANVVIDFSFPYINTSSSKCVMMLLEKLDGAFQKGKQLSLNWYYDEDNDSELECAEEFKEDVTMPFRLIPRERTER